MKKSILFSILFFLVPVLAAEAQAIGGTYAVTGTNPQGGSYQGTCVISGSASSGYNFSWSIASDQYTGTGTLSGSTLTVQWGAPEPVIYQVSPDGARLDGRWGKDGAGSETLTRQ